MRHAKAEQTGATDFERRLSERGHADAAAAGRWLAARGGEPELALVSAAARTQETWESLAEGAGWDLDAELVEGLYSAGTQTALDLLRDVDDGITSVIIVGHNPTMASLAAVLDDGDGRRGGRQRAGAGLPDVPDSFVPGLERRVGKL